MRMDQRNFSTGKVVGPRAGDPSGFEESLVEKQMRKGVEGFKSGPTSNTVHGNGIVLVVSTGMGLVSLYKEARDFWLASSLSPR